MDEHSQIQIPPSFVALHERELRRKTMSRDDLRERYEACEDLALQLVDPAKAAHFDQGIAEDEVLSRCHLALSSSSQLSDAESGWIVRRLCELLDWPQAAFAIEGRHQDGRS